MDAQHNAVKPSAETLLEIIKIQTEIAKLGLDLGNVMSLVIQKTQLLTGASGAVVELAEGNEMVYRAATGIAEPQLGLRLNRFGSLSGLCVEKREILRCEDSDTDDRVDRDACRRVGLRSMLVMPLNHLDSTVGVLKVMSSGVNAFSETDIQVLGLMSDLIAAAMFHAARFETSELYHRATHDGLTGLANRALFYDRLRQCLLQAERTSQSVGIFTLDMDGLKPINDQYGHAAGDAAIMELASRINGTTRKADTAARLGGDEFGIIMSRIDGRNSMELRCRRLEERIAMPFQFQKHKLALAASIGFAVYPEDGTKMDALLEKADQAMYEVKRANKENRV